LDKVKKYKDDMEKLKSEGNWCANCYIGFPNYKEHNCRTFWENTQRTYSKMQKFYNTRELSRQLKIRKDLFELIIYGTLLRKPSDFDSVRRTFANTLTADSSEEEQV
jgi:hypothetical protein